MADMSTGSTLSPLAQNINAVYAATGVKLNINLCQRDDTLDVLMAKAEAVIKSRRGKSARRRGLINKYGRETANEIASRHAGRTIKLQ